MNGFVFVILSRFFPISSWFNSTVIAYGKQLSSFLLIGFIVAFLFFSHSGESMYDPPLFRLIL